MENELAIVGQCPACGHYIWGLPEYVSMEDMKCMNPDCKDAQEE